MLYNQPLVYVAFLCDFVFGQIKSPPIDSQIKTAKLNLLQNKCTYSKQWLPLTPTSSLPHMLIQISGF